MNYFNWHYTEGLEFYFELWKKTVAKTFRFFSVPVLLGSLFAPWKRLTASSSSTGFNLSKSFNELTFNLTSRLIGFMVRFWLIVTAFLVLFLSIPIGLFGFLFWLLVPFISWPYYKKIMHKPYTFAAELAEHLENSTNPIHVLFGNEAGKFVLAHTGIEEDTLIERSVKHFGVDKSKEYQGYAEILAHVLESGVWPEELWRELGISSSDLLIAAKLWDGRRQLESKIDQIESSSTPKGIATQLLFGYTPILDKVGNELRHANPDFTQLRGREDVMTRIDRVLSSRISPLLVGKPGVGKKAILLELANRLDDKYKRLVEVNIVKLTAGLSEINDKKYAIHQLFSEAASAGNVTLVLKDLPRLTSTEIEGIDFTDVLEEQLGNKKLQAVAVVTPEEYEKYLARNYRLMKHFEKIEIEPLGSGAATQVLIDRAAQLENSTDITIPIPVLHKMIASADRYYSEEPFPKKALEILEASVAHAKGQGKNAVTHQEVSQVIAEKTGIPIDTLSSGDRNRLANIESLMKEQLVGQETAISMIAQSLRSRTMGVAGENKPIGTFLFLGPTGVGKTETAKVLSRIYYGHSDIMRFDMAEYVGMEGITKLIGSAQANQPGILTTAIKKNPAGMLLLDEIEKASSDIFNILLTLIDEGYIVDAFGRKIDCRNIFVIATSNAGSETIRKLVTHGVSDQILQREVLEHVLEERIFSPEFVNRFDGVVVYEPLSQDDLTEIAKLKLNELRERMYSKNIQLELHDQIFEKVASDGFDPVFGARPMRRIVDMVIGDAISQAMLSEYVKPGDRVKIHPGEEKHKYYLEKL